MHPLKWAEACLLVFLSIAAGALPVTGGTVPTGDAFIIFDATQYHGKPDLSVYGIQPLPVVYGHFLWKDRKVKNELPDDVFVKRLLGKDRYQADTICLDVEHWDISVGADNQNSIQKYRALLRTAREALPSSKIGYYGIPPKRDYFASIADDKSPNYKAWANLNTTLIELGRDVDILFPSLYTFYRKPGEWERYAFNTIQASKVYGKPIYPFLWPQYHESNRFRGLKYIDTDFWRLQLETVARHAHGVVIWGGWDFARRRPAEWYENAGWWKATKAFILKNKAQD